MEEERVFHVSTNHKRAPFYMIIAYLLGLSLTLLVTKPLTKGIIAMGVMEQSK